MYSLEHLMLTTERAKFVDSRSWGRIPPMCKRGSEAILGWLQMTGGIVERAGVKGTDGCCTAVICTFYQYTYTYPYTCTHIRKRVRVRARKRVVYAYMYVHVYVYVRTYGSVSVSVPVSVRYPYLLPLLFLPFPRSFLPPPPPSLRYPLFIRVASPLSFAS